VKGKEEGSGFGCRKSCKQSEFQKFRGRIKAETTSACDSRVAHRGGSGARREQVEGRSLSKERKKIESREIPCLP